MALRREPDLRLLCERCGYHLKGLMRTDVCPECGERVEASLPQRRRGTQWQREGTFDSWCRTGLRFFVAPRVLWREIGDHKAHGRSLIRINGWVAGSWVLLLMFGPGLLVMALDGGREGRWVWRFAAVCGVAAAAAVIEGLGLGLIGHAMGARTRRGMRVAVLEHLSYAWVASSGVMLVFMLFAMPRHGGFADVSWAMVGVGFGMAFAVYAVFVVIAMRGVRYANAPGSERELAESGDTPLPAAAPPPSPQRGEGGERTDA